MKKTLALLAVTTLSFASTENFVDGEFSLSQHVNGRHREMKKLREEADKERRENVREEIQERKEQGLPPLTIFEKIFHTVPKNSAANALDDEEFTVANNKKTGTYPKNKHTEAHSVVHHAPTAQSHQLKEHLKGDKNKDEKKEERKERKEQGPYTPNIFEILFHKGPKNSDQGTGNAFDDEEFTVSNTKKTGSNTSNKHTEAHSVVHHAPTPQSHQLKEHLHGDKNKDEKKEERKERREQGPYTPNIFEILMNRVHKNAEEKVKAHDNSMFHLHDLMKEGLEHSKGKKSLTEQVSVKCHDHHKKNHTVPHHPHHQKNHTNTTRGHGPQNIGGGAHFRGSYSLH